MIVNEIVKLLKRDGFDAHNKFINTTKPNTACVIYDGSRVEVSDDLTYRVRHVVLISYIMDDPDDAILSISRIMRLVESSIDTINPKFQDPLVTLDGTVYYIEFPFTFEEVIDID